MSRVAFAPPSRFVAFWLVAVLILNLAGLYLLDRLGLAMAGIAWVPIVTVTAFDVLRAERGGASVGTGVSARDA